MNKQRTFKQVERSIEAKKLTVHVIKERQRYATAIQKDLPRNKFVATGV